MTSFGKDERLRGETEIEKLFTQGNQIYLYPLKIVFYIIPPKNVVKPIQILFTVPKRQFKTAVKRNAIRRKLKESFRLLKEELYKNQIFRSLNVQIAIVYLAKNELPFNEIDAALNKIFIRLASELNKCKNETLN
jgi:ribonuclease P protein component